MGLTAIPAGEVGAVVTYLEMREPPSLRPLPPSPLRMKSWADITPAQYRTLFERIGSKWLWFSRLRMDDETLARSIGEVHAVVDPAGIEVGMIELDFPANAECLIRFLGLVPELAGKGHGKWLFAQLHSLTWRRGIKRVRVNTCSLDHPAALPSYLKAGFTAYERAFESFPDPRLMGLLPREAAPQVPVVGSAS